MVSKIPESSLSQSVFLSTLRNPNYAKLLTGQVIAAFGDRINQMALLSIVIYVIGNKTNGGTAKYTADIMFWAILPAVVLGPFAVALIDRWNRKRTMFISDIMRAVLVASLPFLLECIQHHYVIYSIVFLIGIFSSLFGACRLAIMPDLVPSNLLMSANAISSQAGTIGTLVAVPIGGGIAQYFGPHWSFIINAVTYSISACFIWSLKPSDPSPERASRVIHHPWDDFQSGLKYIWQTKPVFFYVFFAGATQCLVAIFFVCFMAYGVDVVSENPKEKLMATIFLFGALGIGMAGGALWLGRFTGLAEKFRWPMLMMVATGIGIWLLSRVTHFWISVPIFFGIGFVALMVMAPLDTYLQKHVPDELRGRVFAARGVLIGFGFLVSLQFSKGIIKQLGVLGTFEILGMAAIILGLYSLWVGKRWFSPNRKLEVKS